MAWRCHRLAGIADYLNKGDNVVAIIGLLHLRLRGDAPPERDDDRLAGAMRKFDPAGWDWWNYGGLNPPEGLAKYSPDQPHTLATPTKGQGAHRCSGYTPMR